MSRHLRFTPLQSQRDLFRASKRPEEVPAWIADAPRQIRGQLWLEWIEATLRGEHVDTPTGRARLRRRARLEDQERARGMTADPHRGRRVRFCGQEVLDKGLEVPARDWGWQS